MTRTLEGHTVQRYDGELNSLHLKVLEMAGLVLDQMEHALRALKQKDIQAANAVLEREHEVDELEVSTDDDVVTVIAKRGPVARDLRVIMSISKTIADLERIGDEATRIAYLTKGLYDAEHSQPSTQLTHDVTRMGHLALEMLHEAMQSFDTLDDARARALICRENELAMEFESGLRRLATFLLEDARNVGHTIHIVLLAKSVERVGDHARNIAEYVVYMVGGEDVRHRLGSYCENIDAAGPGTSAGDRAD
jgi:phosphate transport system protein